MINGIANALSNATLSNIAQDTAIRVSIETGLKAIGRPGFILIDKDIDAETKKYAASKEFFYQALCLAVYLAVIPPIFKAGSYKLAKKIFKNEHPEFSKFKNMKEFLDYHKYTKKVLKERTAELAKPKAVNKFTHDGLREELLMKDEPEAYDLIKGTVEAGSFVGSILGLAILAPEISHHLIHPVMKFFHLDKKEETEPKKLDIKS